MDLQSQVLAEHRIAVGITNRVALLALADSVSFRVEPSGVIGGARSNSRMLVREQDRIHLASLRIGLHMALLRGLVDIRRLEVGVVVNAQI